MFSPLRFALLIVVVAQTREYNSIYPSLHWKKFVGSTDALNSRQNNRHRPARLPSDCIMHVSFKTSSIVSEIIHYQQTGFEKDSKHHCFTVYRWWNATEVNALTCRVAFNNDMGGSSSCPCLSPVAGITAARSTSLAIALQRLPGHRSGSSVLNTKTNYLHTTMAQPQSGIMAWATSVRLTMANDPGRQYLEDQFNDQFTFLTDYMNMVMRGPQDECVAPLES
jgi:hypothetical protein